MPKNSNNKGRRRKKQTNPYVFNKSDETQHKDYQEFINLLQLMNNLKRPEQITKVERILTKQ
tara:strand:- start:330 stop:515 length:186 start_codon:yes stop_codon:yes gene_type:complete